MTHYIFNLSYIGTFTNIQLRSLAVERGIQRGNDMRTGSKSIVQLSVVLSLMAFGCMNVSDPGDYKPDTGDVMPDDDVVSDETSTIGAPDHFDPNLDVPVAPFQTTLLARNQHTQVITAGEDAVVWTSYNVEKNTGAVMMVLHGETVARMVSTGTMPMGVTTDSDHIFWADMIEGTIMKISMETGKISKLVGGLVAPNRVAVDDNHVYFTSAEAGTVSRVSKDGGPAKVLVADQADPGPISVVTSPGGVGYVFFATLGGVGELKATYTTGGGTIVLKSGADFSNGFVFDGGDIFWADPVSRSVQYYSLQHDKTDTLAINQYQVGGLALDGDNVYWTTKVDGTVHSMNRTNGVRRVLAAEQDSPTQLVVSDTRVVWADAEYGSVFAVAK